MRRSAREDVVAKHLRLIRARTAALDAGPSVDPAALQDARLVELGLARLLPELWGIAPATGRPVADGIEAQVLAEIRSSTAVLALQAQEPDAPSSGHPDVAEALYRYAHTELLRFDPALLGSPEEAGLQRLLTRLGPFSPPSS